MSAIEEIKNSIKEELNAFNAEFDKTLKTNNDTLQAVHKHIAANKGKQIRPMLVLLSAKMNGKPNIKTMHAATALEMLHTASLVHDDIVDESTMRRGQQSVNAIWDNKVAVLVGDYLLSQALNTAIETDSLQILRQITELGKELSEGELLQIENTSNQNTVEQKYIDVISKKTAKLFSVCTASGALSTGANQKDVETMRQTGLLYGIAFQIRDDIFDYTSSLKNIGKPVGNDIREGKITLPLIYAINNATEAEKQVVMTIFKEKDFTQDNIDELINFTVNKGGIEYAQQRMKHYSNKAIETISHYPDSTAKDAMVKLITYSTERTN